MPTALLSTPGQRDGFAHRYALLLIIGLAGMIMAPEIAAGISPSESLQYNIVWTEQFRDLLRSGDLYPRWLPRSWDGLGSPTFYIYPPLFFWAAGLVDLLTLHMLPVERLVPTTSFALLALSGLAMYAWLASCAPRKLALAGALFYMAAPYHLYDIYARGALAESSAYTVLPLLLFGFRMLCRGRPAFLPVAAGSYAALVLAHLPSALLVSVFLLPAFILFEAGRSPWGIWRTLGASAASLILGLGLSALYLVPALGLTSEISYDAFFGSFYQPSSWFFWRPAAWPREGPMIAAILVCAAALPVAIQILIGAFRTARHESLFWAAILLLALAMASGALPFLWKLPLIEKVQFPFRFLVIAEFALITAVVVARPRLTNPLIFAGALVWSFALAWAVLLVVGLSSVDPAAKAERIAWTRSEYRDAPEYLPPGSPIARDELEGIPDPGMIALPAVARESIVPAGGAVREQRRKDGGALVRVRTDMAGRVTLRRFYFPHWRITDAAGTKVRSFRGPDGLLAWRVPAGRSTFRVDPGRAPGERLGQRVTVFALALLAMFFFLSRRFRGKGERHLHQSGLGAS